MEIIQFGEGNFLRAFVEWIAQRLGLTVAIVKPRPGNSLDALRAQDCRYHVNLRGMLGGKTIDSMEEITCVAAAVNPYEDYAAFLLLAEQADARFIVSNTTEAGIVFDDACGFDDAPPTSFPAKLTQLLWHRYCAFGGDPEKGFIILPCELIFHNGRQLKSCVDQYIELWREALGEEYVQFKAWVDSACYFCTTLVDRIVPGYPKKDVEQLQARLPEPDPLLVQAEPYHLWVIEVPENMSVQQLSAELPAAEAGLNVVVTRNEGPYHERKVTLLNGPHTVLSPVAWLAGLAIVRDACEHETVGAYVRHVMYDELLPTLDMPESELRRYADDVLERFCNPFVDHQLTSIMLNCFPKYATRDLPALKRYYEKRGELPRGIVLGLAAICVYYRGGQRADGTPIQPNDDAHIMQLLADLWGGENGVESTARRVAEGVLAAKELIWHEHGDLNAIPGLTDMLATYIDNIVQHGIMAVVET